MPVVVQDEDGVAMGTRKVSQSLEGLWQRDSDEIRVRAQKEGRGVGHGQQGRVQIRVLTTTTKQPSTDSQRIKQKEEKSVQSSDNNRTALN